MHESYYNTYLKGKKVRGNAARDFAGRILAALDLDQVIGDDFAMRKMLSSKLHAGVDFKTGLEAAMADNRLLNRTSWLSQLS